MYRTILVTLDRSPADDAVLEHVRPLAKLIGARIILAHVADGFAARNQEQLNLDDSEEIRQDRSYLEQVRVRFASDGIAVETRLPCGEPAAEIVAVAEAERCDLIAMGTHGHRLVKDIFLGSVASEVRHRTFIPVLLVRSRV